LDSARQRPIEYEPTTANCSREATSKSSKALSRLVKKIGIRELMRFGCGRRILEKICLREPVNPLLSTTGSEPGRKSLQLRVLRLGLLQDGDVGVGVLPEVKEIRVGRASFRAFALEGIGACQTETGQRTKRVVRDQAAMVDDFLELRCRFLSLLGQ
jgi:hypothetical protein